MIMHCMLVMVIINRCVMSSPMHLLIMLFCFQRKAHEALLENVPMLKEITVCACSVASPKQ